MKYISYILSLFIAFASISVPVLADSPTLLVNETFDNIATNDSPENITVKSGLNARIVELDKANKALYASADGCPVKINVPLKGKDSKMVFSFDIMVKGSPVNGEALSIDNGTASISLLNFNKNREITLEDGMSISGYSNGKWASYTAMVDFSAGCYNLYVDGKLKLKNRRFNGKAPTPTSINFNFVCSDENGISEVYIDEMRVYTGAMILSDSDFPKKKFNSEVLEFIDETGVEKVYETVFINSNSKQGIGGVSFIQKADTIARWDSMNEGGPEYIHFALTGKNDASGDIYPEVYDDITRYVYQTDVYVVQNPTASVIVARANDGNGGYSNLLYINTSGNLAVDKTAICPIDTKKWVNVAVAVDLIDETCSVYVNRKLVKSGVPLHNGAIFPEYIRIGFTTANGEENEVYFNKIKMYDGLELREFDDELLEEALDADYMFVEKMKKTKAETDEFAINILDDDVAFMTSTPVFYMNGEKHQYSEYGKPAYISNGKIMVDVSVIDNAFNVESKMDGSSVVIEGARYEPEVKDGVYFVDVSLVGKGLSKKVYDTDNRNFAIVSKSDKGYTNAIGSEENQENTDVIWRYLQFDRPSSDELYNDFKSGSQYKSHPRLLITKDEIPALRQRINENINLKNVLNKLIDTCDNYLKGELSKKVVQADGFRTFGSCSSAKQKLIDLSTVYIITGDEKYAKRIWLELENICNWDDWNLTKHFLDSGELGPGVAVAYDTIYDYLTEEQRAFIRKKVTEQYLDYCVGVFTGDSSYKALEYRNVSSNWGAVCGYSMFSIAMVFIDDEPENSVFTQKCKYVASEAMKTFEHIATGTAPDGTWYEGMGYYEYIVQHMGWFLETLDNMCSKDYGFLSVPGMVNLVDYALYYQTPYGSYNKGATTGVNKVFAPEGFIFAKLYNSPEKMALYNEFRQNINVSSFNAQYLLFYDPTFASSGNIDAMPVDKYFKTLSTGIARSSWSSETYLAASGGMTSKYADSHYDKGSFIFEALGERWSIDLGRNGSETMYFVDRTDVHSALVINPDANHKGQAFEKYALLTKFESKPRGNIMVYDLSDVYGEWVSSYRRGFMLGDDRNTLTIRDELTLNNQSNLEWIMMTMADINVSADGKSAVLTQNGKTLNVTANCSASDWKFVATEDAAYTGGWIEQQSQKGSKRVFSAEEQKKFAGKARKLKLVCTGTGSETIQVKLVPHIDGEYFAPCDDSFIDSWTIADGEMPPKPHLDGIYADGRLVEGFVSGTKDYTLSYPYGSKVPSFTATAPLGKVDIKQPVAFSDDAVITVSFDDGRMATYTVKFKVTERVTDAFIPVTSILSLPQNIKLLPVSSVYASHEPQSTNAAINVADGSLDTRWSADGKDVYVELDLGEVYDLSGIAIAYMEGATRNYLFDILVSEDKMDYKRVYSGRSSGKTNDYEYFEMPVRARYVRYVGNQHTTGVWNSVTEFRPAVLN